MGLLSLGTPLEWDEAKKYADIVREKGITQFINVHKNLRNRTNDGLKWGDEVEFSLVKFDHKNKRCYLLLKSYEILPALQEAEQRNEKNLITMWRPEYANYMIEGTPGSPYEHQIDCFNKLEANMGLRRKQAQELLGPDEYVLSITNFPLLGCKNFTWPNHNATPGEGLTYSLFYCDEAIYSVHPRFILCSMHTRKRRKAKVCINVPIFKDTNTPSPFVEDLKKHYETADFSKEEVKQSLIESTAASKPDHIYLDAMGFGMGCCCLQMTFQAKCLEEAKKLYDELTPLTPIVLALSASSPIWRGYLTDVDCRWNVLSAACDDRTKEELGIEPLKNDRFVINKSRYGTIDCYLSEENKKYNDLNIVKDERLHKRLVDNGVDNALADHVSHLFIRDPLVVFKEKLDIDDNVETDHFENIQSTNWQNMRFKPPPHNSPIGWRVEFRPCELQITDFENAAFVTFLILMTRAILSFNLNMLMPISLVDRNMETAQKRDACQIERFYFRKNIYSSKDEEAEICEMTIDEIINGSDRFPGCLQLIKDYLSNLDVDVDTQCTIKQYLELIEARASGKLMTMASWIRKFVSNHPKYEKNSIISEEMNYDLLWKIHLISTGQLKCPELLFDYKTKTSI